MGLLLPHKRTLRVYPDMVSVFCPADHHQSGGGKRGKVTVFSPESRYRLFRLLHQLEFSRVTFVTLTYPAQFPQDAKIYKAHLKEYRRRFERLYGPLKAVWRLEFQERGAPHYHIMYLDAPFIDVHEWCWLWKCVVKSIDMAHEQVGVDVKLVTGGRESKLIASYLAKYVGKIDQTEVKNNEYKPGRWWGKWNIEETAPIEYTLDDRTAFDLVLDILSNGRDPGAWQPVDPTVCTVFGNSMGRDDFRDFVRGLAEGKYQKWIRRKA